MSLRRRVLLGCLIVTLVLVGADVALAATSRSFLLHRVDTQVSAAAKPIARAAIFPRPAPNVNRPRVPFPAAGERPFTEYFTEVFDKDGKVVRSALPGLRRE